MKKTDKPLTRQPPHNQQPLKTIQISEKQFRHRDRGTQGGRIKGA
jgi:hypothetical protein